MLLIDIDYQTCSISIFNMFFFLERYKSPFIFVNNNIFHFQVHYWRLDFNQFTFFIFDYFMELNTFEWRIH